MSEVGEWQRVVHAADCTPCRQCGELVCPACSEHYGDCECPGPTQDGLEYRYDAGVLFARPDPDREND